MSLKIFCVEVDVISILGSRERPMLLIVQIFVFSVPAFPFMLLLMCLLLSTLKLRTEGECGGDENSKFPTVSINGKDFDEVTSVTSPHQNFFSNPYCSLHSKSAVNSNTVELEITKKKKKHTYHFRFRFGLSQDE